MKKVNYYPHYSFLKKITFLFLMFISSTALFSQHYHNVVNHYLNGTFEHGVKIKTNLPFTHIMPTIKIEGYAYGKNKTLGLIISCYIYNGNMLKSVASSHGGSTPEVWLSNEDGKLVIFLNEKSYYKRFTVSAFAMGLQETSAHFEGWTVEDTLLSGTQQTRVDYTNNFAGKVGIDTNVPQATLHINSGANTDAAILATSSEDNKLIVHSYSTSPVNSEVFRLEHAFGNNRNNGYISFFRGSSSNNGFLEFGTSGSPRMRINTQGNVGIGTTNPQHMLDVAGSIRAREIKVELTAGADFVFKPGYDLMPLSEVQSFIESNNHLPGIQSEEEMIENGLSVNEFQIKLLQKIEELTLYMIEQQNEINELKQKLSANGK